MIRRILLSSVLVAASGCTALDLWDTPAVIVEPMPCNDNTDCAGVQFEITDDSVRTDPCIVAKRVCDSGRGQCTISLEARDSDGDDYRDVACAGEHPEFEPTRVDCDDTNDDAFPNADFDRDTFYARGCGNGKPEDCDDTRATAFPGQTVEACDGVFSMCPVGDTTAPARNLDEDFDGDRVSPIGLAESVCVDVFNRDGDLISSARTDCDDADALVYPGAVEVCDGRDNDCRLATGVGPDPLEDADGDGFSSPNTTACDPSQEGGFPNTDCDDEDGKTYPGAPESCDRIVNDCDLRTATNVSRQSIEDPDDDGYFSGDADCIDPVVNIECNGSAFDRYARTCAPRVETAVASGVDTAGSDRMLVVDLNADGIEEVIHAQPTNPDCAGPTNPYAIWLRYSTNPLTPLASAPATPECSVAVKGFDVAEIDGTAVSELLVATAAGDLMVHQVTVAGATMTLGDSTDPVLTGVAIADSAVFTAAELDGTAGAEVVARVGTSLVWANLPADGITDPTPVVIDATAQAAGIAGVRVADVTNDGIKDVVAFSSASTTLLVYVGAAGPTFPTSMSIDVAALLPGIGTIRDVVADDLEGGGDGDIDLVVRGETAIGIDASFGLLANRPAGFQGVPLGVAINGATLSVGALRPIDIRSRDVEGDGRPNLLFASRATDTVAYVEEIGSNLFAQHVVVSDFDGALLAGAGDFDLDGDADVVAYANSQNQLSMFTATFVSDLSFVERPIDRAFNNVEDSAVADIDGDGRLDVVSVGDEIHVWRVRSVASSTFDELTVLDDSPAYDPTSIAVGDVNGDGSPDIAFVAKAEGEVRWIRSNGDATFGAPDALTTFDKPSDVELADLDADGLDELIVSSEDGTEGRLALYARPVGAAAFTRTILATGTASCADVSVGDIDADTDLDIAVACKNEGLFVFFNPHVGGGGWNEVAIDQSGASYVSAILGDLDRDGDADLVAGRGTNSIVIQRFQGGLVSGALQAIPVTLSGAIGIALTLADLDVDGDPDIVVSGIGPSGAIRVLQALDPSAGRYAIQTIDDVANSPQSLTAGDLDGDGDPDVVAAIRGDSDLVFWLTGGTPWWNN